jgi:hypothetical protein
MLYATNHLCLNEEEDDQTKWTTLCGRICTTDNRVKAQYMREYFSGDIDYTSFDEPWCKNCMRTKEFTLALLANVP